MGECKKINIAPIGVTGGDLDVYSWSFNCSLRPLDTYGPFMALAMDAIANYIEILHVCVP